MSGSTNLLKSLRPAAFSAVTDDERWTLSLLTLLT